MSKIINFGIIGCGVISNWHAQAISETDGAKLYGVTDVYEPSRVAFAEKYKVKAFDSVDALLACDKIDAVCICTPSGLHAPLAVQAAKAGKHIVVEKPMAITNDEIAEILKACEENKVKMSVVSQMRFTPGVQTLKKIVDKNLVGKVVVADLSMKFYRSPEYYKSGGWRGTWKMDGGGALMNQGIHGIDVMQYIMGRVKSVSAITRTLARDIEVEDTAVAILEFENGALGQIVGTTSISPGKERTLEISGTNGSVFMEGEFITEWNVEGMEQPEETKLPIGDITNSANDPTCFGIKGHCRQINDLVDAIQNDRAPKITQYDGARPVEIILAIYESSKTGKVVYLNK